MTPDAHASLAVALVLFAALLHAVTNALVKVSGDPLITRGAISAIAAVVMLPALAFVDVPRPEALPILLCSVPLHASYAFLVAGALHRGDLSAVFPVSRGISPLGVAALAVVFAAATPTWAQAAGVALVCLGILLIAKPARAGAPSRGALGYALATGAVVAGYTYLDAIGMRAARDIASYIVWLVVLDGICTCAAVALARGKDIRLFLASSWKRTLLAAALGLTNFTLAMVALGLGPMIEIAALRETSIIFAAFIGTRFLGEAFGRRRILAAVIVTIGIVLMQLYA